MLKEHNGVVVPDGGLEQPLALAGVEGTTTLTPGMWAAQAWMDWEC